MNENPLDDVKTSTVSAFCAICGWKDSKDFEIGDGEYVKTCRSLEYTHHEVNGWCSACAHFEEKC